MSKPEKMDLHLDIRVSQAQLTMIMQRVPEGVGIADWVRATLLAETVQRGRVVRRKSYRDCTPYKQRLRQDALLSVAATLGRLAGSGQVGDLRDELQELLGLVRRKILKEEPAC